jgi:hypothetical protein
MMQSNLIPQVPGTELSLKQENDKLVFHQLLDTYPTINNINLLKQYYSCGSFPLEQLHAKNLSRSSMPTV